MSFTEFTLGLWITSLIQCVVLEPLYPGRIAHFIVFCVPPVFPSSYWIHYLEKRRMSIWSLLLFRFASFRLDLIGIRRICGFHCIINYWWFTVLFGDELHIPLFNPKIFFSLNFHWIPISYFYCINLYPLPSLFSLDGFYIFYYFLLLYMKERNSIVQFYLRNLRIF